MSCPQTGLILRLVVGELASSEAEDLRQHLTECLSCQATWSQLRETWQALGEWEVVLPQHLQNAIVVAPSELKPAKGVGAFQSISRSVLLRIAASLVLATGLGIAAGTLVPIPGSKSSPSERSVPSEADVAESLGIPELGAGPATGLGRGLVNGEPSGQKEVSS